MPISLFLPVGQAKSMMKLDHHAYKISVMNNNERDRLGFKCQFLSQYLTCGEDIGTHHGCTLHPIEQELRIHMEGVMIMGPRHQNSHNILYLERMIEEQT